MRTILLPFLLGSLLAAAAAPALAAPSPTPVPLDAAKPSPPKADAFPVPKDAGPAEAAPGGGGKILLYKIPRGRAAVVAEVKAALTGAWTITKSTESPSGNAIRLEVKNGDKTYKVSFTGDDTRTAMILTLP